ncbi:hypothetical protein EON63_15410 [archaeon]|nr:MAG: hypothetical protein EON63_15410 [archaeon]
MKDLKDQVTEVFRHSSGSNLVRCIRGCDCSAGNYLEAMELDDSFSLDDFLLWDVNGKYLNDGILA